MKSSEFYKYVDSESAHNVIDTAVATGKLLQSEADLIKSFVIFRQTTRASFGMSRYLKYCVVLTSIRSKNLLTVPWNTAKFSDITALVGNIKNYGYAISTQTEYIILSKLFYSWLIEEGHVVPDVQNIEKKLKNIHTPKADIVKIDSKTDILTKEEIQDIISVSKSIRDKALFGLWYELALRPNEVAGLQWSDVTFDDGGCYVLIRTTKTRYKRNIWCSLYYNHLLLWKNTTRFSNPSDFIFCKDDGSHLYANNLAYLATVRMKEAGCKPVSPYHIRHSRAMHLILSGVKETTVKMILEGHVDTDIIKHYITPDDQTIRDELMVHYGLVNKTPMQVPLTPSVCPKCNYVNTPDSAFCRHCGMALSPSASDVLDNVEGLSSTIGINSEDNRQVGDMTVDELLSLLKDKMRTR